MPLVLTTNDVVLNPDHAWNDIEGVQYHYPNQYKSKIRPGEEFVYYRGVHRRSGRRGTAEYFGRGRIGAIRQDPQTVGSSRPSWFCAIEDYRPFRPPVPAKPSGVFFEQIPQNMWRNGVRGLAPETFAAIVAAAELGTSSSAEAGIPILAAVEVETLIIPPGKADGLSGNARSWRKSKQAKMVGDAAERVAMDFIANALAGSEIVHRAGHGETPGWDIDFRDPNGEFHRVEVKGSVGGAFTSIDITAGELKAAMAHGEGYWIYLVAGCLGERPRIQRIRNPASKLASGEWTSAPSVYTVRLG